MLLVNAVRLKPSGYILDTLAQCFYVNGLYKKAVETELMAIKVDPSQKSYYEKQLRKFLLKINKKVKKSDKSKIDR